MSARTMCEAFQATARERREDVALRTQGEELVVTWEEYAGRVRRIATACTRAGSDRQLATLVGRLISRPLWRRPLGCRTSSRDWAASASPC